MISIMHRNQEHDRNLIFNQLAKDMYLAWSIFNNSFDEHSSCIVGIGGCFCHRFPKEQINSSTQKPAEIMKYVHVDSDCH